MHGPCWLRHKDSHILRYVNQLSGQLFCQCFCFSRNDFIYSISLLIVFVHVFNMSSAIAIILIDGLLNASRMRHCTEVITGIGVVVSDWPHSSWSYRCHLQSNAHISVYIRHYKPRSTTESQKGACVCVCEAVLVGLIYYTTLMYTSIYIIVLNQYIQPQQCSPTRMNSVTADTCDSNILEEVHRSCSQMLWPSWANNYIHNA